MEERVPCISCGRSILRITAEKNEGECRLCRPNEVSLRAKQEEWKVAIVIGLIALLFGAGLWVLFFSVNNMRINLLMFAAPAVGLYFILQGLISRFKR